MFSYCNYHSVNECSCTAGDFPFSCVLFNFMIWFLNCIFLLFGQTHWLNWSWTSLCKLAIFLDTNTKQTRLKQCKKTQNCCWPFSCYTDSHFSSVKYEPKLKLQSVFMRNKWAGTSLVVRWLRLQAHNAGDPGTIPGQGTGAHMLQPRVCMPKLRPGAAR